MGTNISGKYVHNLAMHVFATYQKEDFNMKIDAHIHITPPDIIRDYKKVGEREPYFKMLSDSPKNKFATAEDVIKELDLTGMDKGIVFGFSFMDSGFCKAVNDYTAEMVKKYPDRLIGFMSLSPTDKAVEKEIDRAMGLGLVGVGEIFPDGQGFEIENEEGTRLFCGLLAERDLPVIIHSNEPVGHYYPGKTKTTPVRIAAFAENNPNLRIIFAHWGGGLFFYELMPELRNKFKNVYYDTAASTFLYDIKIYEVAKTAGLLDKIVLGSDYPLLSPKRNIDEINNTNLTDSDKELIFGENAARFLRLK